MQFAGSDNMVARAAWVSNESELQTKWLTMNEAQAAGLDYGRHERLDPRELEPGKVEGLINYLYRNRHMSPFEHGLFTFYVETPIFVAREFMRHRTFSYNEMSGRYTQLPARFYIPPADRPMIQKGKVGAYTFDPATEEQVAIAWAHLQHDNEAVYNSYLEMLDAGVAREVARMSLPVNLMTRFYASCNPRNLMQYLTLRTEGQALFEIQSVANKMESIFMDKMPLTHKAYRV